MVYFLEAAVVVNLPTYIPLAEAARRYRLDRETLTRLVEAGTIRAVKVNGSVAVAKEDIDLATIRVDEKLRGRPIRVTEAAEKYGVNQANLSRWADAGYIRVLQRRPRLLELDEADVKLAAEIFKRAREETGSYVRAGWILKRTMEQLRAG